MELFLNEEVGPFNSDHLIEIQDMAISYQLEYQRKRKLLSTFLPKLWIPSLDESDTTVGNETAASLRSGNRLSNPRPVSEDIYIDTKKVEECHQAWDDTNAKSYIDSDRGKYSLGILFSFFFIISTIIIINIIIIIIIIIIAIVIFILLFYYC